jgi:3-dehydroquinate synthetase
MVAAVFHSVATERCPREDLDRLLRLLERMGLPTRCAQLDPQAIAARTHVDKKRKGGAARVVLTEGVGSVSVAANLSENAVQDAVEFLRREGTE